MGGIHYAAVVVAAQVAFVGSLVWYRPLGRELATVSTVFVTAQKQNHHSPISVILDVWR